MTRKMVGSLITLVVVGGLLVQGLSWVLFGTLTTTSFVWRVLQCLLSGAMFGGGIFLLMKLAQSGGHHMPDFTKVAVPVPPPTACGHDTDMVVVVFHDGDPMITAVTRVAQTAWDGEGEPPAPTQEELPPQIGRNLLNMAIGAIENVLVNNKPGEPL